MASAPSLEAASSPIIDNENSEVKPDADILPLISQEKLLEKLGLGSVQHIALQSSTVQSASNGENRDVVSCKEEDESPSSTDTPALPVSNASSTKSSRSTTPLSLLNGNHDLQLTKKATRVSCQKLKVESLKEELQCEETKLLLLKKILESQTVKRNGSAVRSKDQPHGRNVHPSLHSKHSKGIPHGDPNKVQIAPKVVLPQKGAAAGGSNMPRVVPSIVSGANTKTQVQGASYSSGTGAGKPGSGSNAGTPPGLNSSVRKYYIQVGSQLVPASAAGSAVYSPSTHYGGSGNHTHTPSASSAQRHSESPVDAQVNKQTVAKNALRRQLEQTLLQIPPPNPPPADWNTIPNVNSMDFMMLVGLDEIVDMILDLDGKPTMKAALLKLVPSTPRICDQCNVDFSPAWKTKPSCTSGVVLCERCAVSNVKKDLKAEHTSRLKSAFIKALKQEQDIEEKIKAGEDVSFSVSDRSESASGNSHVPSQSGHMHQHTHQPSNQSERHRQVVHRHHHPVVSHYPRHTSLVHQLHQQHMQQQPSMEVDAPTPHHSSTSSSSGSSSSTARWHPYIPGGGSSHSHHSRIHTPAHGQQQQSRRGYGSNTANGRQEYHYVVHHPQHSNVRWSR